MMSARLQKMEDGSATKWMLKAGQPLTRDRLIKQQDIQDCDPEKNKNDNTGACSSG